MKRSLLLLMGAMAVCTQLSAQGTMDQYVKALDRDFKVQVVTTGSNIEEGSSNAFSGNPFFNTEWEHGYVRLMDKRMAENLSLKYNAYTNQIYLRRDSQVVVLDSSVPVAEFGLQEGFGVRVFRRGYPDAGSNTASTFYELIADGKLSLLRYHAKKIMEKQDINHVPLHEMTDADFYYVFVAAGNRTIEIKHNKGSLMNALPGQAEAIKTIIETKKLKMKSDADWVILFNELNSKG